MFKVQLPIGGARCAVLTLFLCLAAVVLSSPPAHAQLDTSIMSNPKDRTPYWRPLVAEDMAPRGRIPSAAGTGGSAGPAIFMCDVVINNTDSTLTMTDTFGDEEPSIAINPANTNEIVILSFCESWDPFLGTSAPLWHSLDGGVTWTKSFSVNIPTGLLLAGPEDQAPDYGRNNQLSAVFLATDYSTLGTDSYAGMTTTPAFPSFTWPTAGGVTTHANRAGIGNNDQPWLLVNPDPNVTNQDNVYVAYDDFSGSPDMRVAVSRGVNPPSFTTDRRTGVSSGSVNPGHRLAKDPRTGYIYSLFQRRTGAGAGGSQNINFTLTRSTDGGFTWGLNGNSGGAVVANADSTQPTPKFGTANALLGGVDHAAVDPNTGDLYYVYGNRDATTGKNRLAIRRLTDDGAGGLNIGPEVFVTGQVQAALPSVAVNVAGVVAVLYDTFDGLSPVNSFPTYTAHLSLSVDAGATFTDTVLYQFLSSATDNGDPRQRVLGDYQQLKSLGTTFYGVFTANGAQLGRPFANHDPIFFKTDVIPPPIITKEPASQTVFQGDAAALSVAANSYFPASYQWQLNGSPISGATNSILVFTSVALSDAGPYTVTVTNAAGPVTSSNATLVVIPTVPLPYALDATNLTWTTNGNVGWHGLTNVSHDGIAAGESGPILNSQTSRMSTTVTGPATLTFWWKVSSQLNADFLRFQAYSGAQTNADQEISGEVDWQPVNVLLPAGQQTLQWTYSKDAALSAGTDAGWVDQVGFRPGFVLPFILNQPVGLGTLAGAPVTFAVTASGTPTLSYQWMLEGTPVPGATATSLSLQNPGITDAGNYSVRVANSYGATNSINAFLGIVPLVTRGDNSLGQIDVSLATTNAIAIAAGAWHSLILRNDGSLLAFGDDYDGQIDIPANLKNVLTIAGGGYHSLAARLDGTVVAWGANAYGQTNVPAGLSNVIAIAAGTWHSLALRADGTVVAWGDDSLGQTDVPPGLSHVLAIAAGGGHSLALGTDGTVVAWGDNYDANGNFAGQSTVPFDLTNVVAIGAGDYHSLAVKADGTVVAWGDDSEGQSDPPPGLANAVAIAGGGAHTVALKADSTVVAWGNDWNGQCDLSPSISNVVAIAAGYSHTMLLEANRAIRPQLMHPAHTQGQFSLLLQTFAGRNYTLEYKTDLSAATWIAAATIRGNGGLQYVVDPAATGPRRFYHVREW